MGLLDDGAAGAVAPAAPSPACSAGAWSSACGVVAPGVGLACEQGVQRGSSFVAQSVCVRGSGGQGTGGSTEPADLRDEVAVATSSACMSDTARSSCVVAACVPAQASRSRSESFVSAAGLGRGLEPGRTSA